MERKTKSVPFFMILTTFMCYSNQKEPFFEKPALTSPQMLLHSIQDDLRKPEYRNDILPNNFSYPLQLFQCGKRLDQPRIFFESTFSLFSKLLKGAPYVNAYIFSDFLSHVPTLMQHHFVPAQFDLGPRKLLTDIDMLDRFQETVNSLLYNQLKTNWGELTSKPLNFLERVTKSITDVAQDEINIMQLRHALTKFIEVGLSKLVWSPEDCDESWALFKKVSEQLAKLLELNILDDVNELDDLYWSLVHRYCYFINIMSNDLPLDFYHKIYTEVMAEDLNLPIFTLDEQEKFMETKKECLQRTLVTGKACRQKVEHEGLLVFKGAAAA